MLGSETFTDKPVKIKTALLCVGDFTNADYTIVQQHHRNSFAVSETQLPLELGNQNLKV
jgi:hypothetical protein